MKSGITRLRERAASLGEPMDPDDLPEEAPPRP
jgi:hypothetical protein